METFDDRAILVQMILRNASSETVKKPAVKCERKKAKVTVFYDL